jgi:hypothetical protein
MLGELARIVQRNYEREKRSGLPTGARGLQ